MVDTAADTLKEVLTPFPSNSSADHKRDQQAALGAYRVDKVPWELQQEDRNTWKGEWGQATWKRWVCKEVEDFCSHTPSAYG